jgi:hypothetical protein
MEQALIEFVEFPKIARLNRPVIVTEKIDGTNACIVIGEDGSFRTGSRTRWIMPDDDNFGFSRWAHEHRDELVAVLGPGTHYGEWWGSGIQRGYGLAKGEKRFSLFNATRWNETKPPTCCHVVPVLASGVDMTATSEAGLLELERRGSSAAPGFMRPEGVVVYHTASRQLFKVTLEGDAWKGKGQ